MLSLGGFPFKLFVILPRLILMLANGIVEGGQNFS